MDNKENINDQVATVIDIDEKTKKNRYFDTCKSIKCSKVA